jgi:hypothetical protein
MTVCIYIWSTGFVLQVPQDCANPIEKRLVSCVDYIELNYDMTIVISIYTLYLNCIHQNLV